MTLESSPLTRSSVLEIWVFLTEEANQPGLHRRKSFWKSRSRVSAIILIVRQSALLQSPYVPPKIWDLITAIGGNFMWHTDIVVSNTKSILPSVLSGARTDPDVGKNNYSNFPIPAPLLF